MKETYYYVEDMYGGYIVDKSYMANEYNEEKESLIMSGTLEEIYDYIDLYSRYH